jgi:hypothetical protein
LQKNIVVNGEEFHKLPQILEIRLGLQDHLLMGAKERKVVLLVVFLLLNNFVT